MLADEAGSPLTSQRKLSKIGSLSAPQPPTREGRGIEQCGAGGNVNTLSELVAGLRRRSAPVIPIEGDTCPPAFLANPHTIEGYVWPNIEMAQNSPGARVLLIEAIGAVGKSAAAAAIADRLNWPVIESARAQVGSYSLTGLLHDALGFDSDFMAEVSRGDSGLVVDSLDEAHLRAGTSNLLAFLENVNSLANTKAGSGVSVVMLSRPDTAGIIRMAFEEFGAPLMEVRLEFFDALKAATFINSYLRRQVSNGKSGSYDVVIKHPKAFAELRDHRLKFIAEAMLGHSISNLVNAWTDVRSFLGYAPVLEVLSEALAVANPHKDLAKKPAIAISSRKILLDLVKELLDREQGKFSTQTADSLLARLPADVEVKKFAPYDADEQAGRLIAKMIGIDYSGDRPLDIPDAIRADYEAHANQFLQDHPFLEGRHPVNVVFGDYLLARASTDPTNSLAGKPVQIEEAAVGPFYYRFVQEMAPTRPGDSNPTVREGIVSALVASQIKSQPVTSLDRASLWGWTQSDGAASLEIYDPGVDDYLNFAVEGLTGALAVRGQLRQAIILTDEGIILSEKDGRFAIGPMAIVVCDELLVDSPLLQVEGVPVDGADRYPNMIAARRFDAARLSRIEVSSPDLITIRGACPWPLLRPYVAADGEVNFTAYSAYMDLRALFRFFRLGAGAAPNVFAEKLEQGIVKKNERRSRYLSRLCEAKIFWKADSHYYLDTQKLADHSLNLQKLLDGQPGTAVFSFIDWLDRGPEFLTIESL